jgi:hypothetical protein
MSRASEQARRGENSRPYSRCVHSAAANIPFDIEALFRSAIANVVASALFYYLV